MKTAWLLGCCFCGGIVAGGVTSAADEVRIPPQPTAGAPAHDAASADGTADRPGDAETGWTPLNPQQTVLLDVPGQRVVLKSTVVLREGVLEMFACRRGSKEHESVVAVDTEAYVIHAALLAVGAEPGKPVQWTPEYAPPTGQKVDIFVQWKEADGTPRRERATRWVRHVTRRYYVATIEPLPADVVIPEESELRYHAARKELVWFGPMTDALRDECLALCDRADYQQAIRSFHTQSQPQEMQADWLFTGSGFFVDDSGRRFYQAESGNLICVANFSDAIIDVSVRSTAANEELLFEPYTERIPPLGTEVLIELLPVPRTAPKSDPLPQTVPRTP
jgi:hypothetical protein